MVKENLKNEADEGFKRVASVNKQLNANLGQKQREVVKLNAELAKLKKKVTYVNRPVYHQFTVRVKKSF